MDTPEGQESLARLQSQGGAPAPQGPPTLSIPAPVNVGTPSEGGAPAPQGPPTLSIPAPINVVTPAEFALREMLASSAIDVSTPEGYSRLRLQREDPNWSA